MANGLENRIFTLSDKFVYLVVKLLFNKVSDSSLCLDMNAENESLNTNSKSNSGLLFSRRFLWSKSVEVCF